METNVKIMEQMPNVARTYTAQDGSAQVFNSRGFRLSTGIDEFYAEMVGEAAVKCPEYDLGSIHRMQGQMRTRSYRDKHGETRYVNEIIISKLI